MVNRSSISVGDKFGRWTAIEGLTEYRGSKKYLWFRCDCGTEKLCQEYDVKVGKSKSCGCHNLEQLAKRGGSVPGRFSLGDRFGRLEVISNDFESHRNGRHWRCRCDCGNEGSYGQSALAAGNTTSCGCFFKERAVENNTKHGHNSWKQPPSSTYNSWRGAKERCHNENHIGYKNYGGRGIRMCSRWQESFAAFLEDMGSKPSPDLTLERVDHNGNYEPANCVWASQETQANNKSNNVKLTYRGETLTVPQWSRRTGIPAPTLYGRLKRGLAPSEILSP